MWAKGRDKINFEIALCLYSIQLIISLSSKLILKMEIVIILSVKLHTGLPKSVFPGGNFEHLKPHN